MKTTRLAAKSTNPEKFHRVIELLQDHLKNMSNESRKNVISSPSSRFLREPEWKQRFLKSKFYTVSIGSGKGAHDYSARYVPTGAYIGFSPEALDLTEFWSHYELSEEIKNHSTGNNLLYFIFRVADHHFTDITIEHCIDLSSSETAEEFVDKIITNYLNPREDKKEKLQLEIAQLQEKLAKLK